MYKQRNGKKAIVIDYTVKSRNRSKASDLYRNKLINKNGEIRRDLIVKLSIHLMVKSIYQKKKDDTIENDGETPSHAIV